MRSPAPANLSAIGAVASRTGRRRSGTTWGETTREGRSRGEVDPADHLEDGRAGLGREATRAGRLEPRRLPREGGDGARDGRLERTEVVAALEEGDAAPRRPE